MINPYLSAPTLGQNSEQNLVESMNIEAIQISGQNYIYIPRTLNKLDQIFGEDVLSSFESYAEIEMWLQDFSGYGGESEILSRFGMEIRDTATFIVSLKRFAEEVIPIFPSNRSTNLVRPCEGDLIYSTHTKSLFEIKFLEDEEPGFYQLNKKYVYVLRCELIILNNEKFNTGFEEVDNSFGATLNRIDNSLLQEDSFHILTESGGYLLSEDYVISKLYDPIRSYGDNDEIKKQFVQIMDFSEDNPFSEY